MRIERALARYRLTRVVETPTNSWNIFGVRVFCVMLPFRSGRFPGLQGAHPCCSTDHYGSFVFHTLFLNDSGIGPEDGAAPVCALPQVARVSLCVSRR